MRCGAIAAALAVILLACPRTSPPEVVPEATVVVAVRAPSSTARVVATADDQRPLELRARSRGEFAGTLGVTAGRHSVRVEALDARRRQVASLTLEVASSRGDAAQLVGALPPAVESASGGPGLLLVTQRASVVAGDSLEVAAYSSTSADGATPLAWTAEPRGCGTFSSPTAAVTRFSAIATGTCTVTLSAMAAGRTYRESVPMLVRSRGTGYEYPLRVATGGRYLVDRRGAPFFLKGETAWLALANLSADEQERYLADRAARGFNVVEVMLMNHDYTSSPNPTPPRNRYGEEPLVGGDLARPNDAYFDRVVAFVDRAAAHGIVVLAAPTYLGFDGGREGWWERLVSPETSRAACFDFGLYIGLRLKDRANLVWLAGGDFAPPPGSEGEARHLEVLRGIKAAGASQLWTGHWNVRHLGGISTDEAAFGSLMDLNGVYQYALPYRYTARALAVAPPRPVFLLESAYEHEHPRSNVQPFRKAWWWTMLSGGSGLLWGNAFLWTAEAARGTYAADYGDTDHAISSWAGELDSPGTQQVLHLHAFFEALPWWRLVPSGSGAERTALVTAGQGWSSQEHIAAAATKEGDLLVAYVPPTGRGARHFELDLSRMRGPARARWFDPTLGAFVPSRDGVPPARGVGFDTPGMNGGGLNDWVLVVDIAASSDAVGTR